MLIVPIASAAIEEPERRARRRSPASSESTIASAARQVGSPRHERRGQHDRQARALDDQQHADDRRALLTSPPAKSAVPQQTEATSDSRIAVIAAHA